MSGVHVLSLEQASSPWNWDDAVWTADMVRQRWRHPQRGVNPAGLTH